MTDADRKTADREKAAVHAADRRSSLLQTAILLIGLAGLTALMTVLAPCGPKDDGTWMHCHDAGQILRLLTALTAVAALIAKIRGGKTAARIADGVALVSGVLMLVIPGTVIPLCMMPQMRCRAVMRPGAMIIGVLLLIAAILDLAAGRERKRR